MERQGNDKAGPRATRRGAGCAGVGVGRIDAVAVRRAPSRCGRALPGGLDLRVRIVKIRFFPVAWLAYCSYATISRGTRAKAVAVFCREAADWESRAVSCGMTRSGDGPG